MEKTARAFWTDALKTGLFSLIFACLGVLVLALLAKLCGISDTLLPIINQVIKGIAVILGVLFCVKQDKFFWKAILGAIIYWLLSTALFSVLGGAFHFGQVALDLGVSLVLAAVTAMLKSRRA